MLYYDNDQRQFSVVQDRQFGTKSKVLGALAPGAWHAKEAAKYAYDTEAEYKKNRANYALRGALTPGTATALHMKVAKMHREGKSAKEIRDYLNKNKGKHALVGAGEVLTGGLGGVTHSAALGKGMHDALTDTDRKKFKK